MEITTAKIIACLALGIGSFFTGMIPAGISESTRQRHPLTISCLLCFGAGVLLATSLVHMLPEAREDLPQFSEILLCVGFFMVYCVDEIVHIFYGNGDRPGHQRQSYGSEQTSLLRHHDDLRGADGEMDPRRCCGDTENPRMCHVSHTEPCNKTSSGFVGLLCALFVHSLLEGLAIGLQKSSAQVLLLLGAVASHKFVVGFCLGAELCAAGRALCAHVAWVALFAGGSVAGIALGAGLEAVQSIQDSVAVPIMQALAAGTLHYVTVSEVLPRERARFHEQKRWSGMAQLAAVLAGFAGMYLSTRYLDHD
ncbi:zinc transporter ZIP3 [Cydia fagiglandana]|uniref:zinc transporter ZIP3 n=1 Tax=Cydia fagiglandana TaxID=1458189 RepID=UPI002FEE0136